MLDILAHAAVDAEHHAEVAAFGIPLLTPGFFVALAFASASFDASILELLLAVGSAGALVVVPPGTYGGAVANPATVPVSRP